MPRRVIRKLDIAGRPSFDEQLWPINALLVVLCGLSAGAIVGTSDFTRELDWSNGWVRLATLLASVALLMALAWWFRGKLGRRFQLGAMASLLVHAILAILLSWQYLSLLEENRDTAKHETPPVLVQFEYHLRSPDERVPQEAHERPVETEQPEDRHIQLERTAPAEPQIEPPQPQPLPQTQRSVEPTQLQMKRNELAAPARAEQESRQSRATTEAPAQPSEQISAPEQRAAAEPASRPIESRATTVSRSETQPSMRSAAVETPRTIEVARDAAQPARRTAETPSQPLPSNAAAASRTIAQATAAPAPATEAPSAVAASAATLATQPAPSPTDLARTTASPPTASAPAQVPTPSAAAVTAPAASAVRSAAASAPTIAAAAAQGATAPPRAAANAPSPASPVNLQSPALATTGSAADRPQPPQPAAASVTRATSGTTGHGDSPNFDSGLPGPASQVAVASAASQRAASTIDPGPAPAASAPSPVPRSRAQALLDSTTALAENAAAADNRAGPAPAELEATSSAAIARQASAAPAGRMAAAAGDLPADTGAPQVVSRGGLSRSDGGGQPNVAAVANAGQPPRATVAGQSIASTASEVAAPSPAAPDSDNAASAAVGPSIARDEGSRHAAVGAVATTAAGVGNISVPGAPTEAASPARAAVAAELAGASSSFGSVGTPGRTTTSAFAADDDIQLALTPQGTGAGTETSLQASATRVARSTATLPDLGTLPGATAAPGTPNGTSAGVVVDRALSAADPSNGPQVTRRASLARSTTMAIPAAAGEAIEAPALASNAPIGDTSTPGDSEPGPSTGPSDQARRASGGVPVQIAAVAGPGGLATELSAVVGSRRLAAQRDSELIHDSETRFLGREIAGAIPEPSFIREAAKAFERRGRDTGAGVGQRGAKTEEAIERGLEYLARSQQPDGSWSFQKFSGATADDAGSIQSDTAATGLALMAFLGGGYDHFEDKHRDTVRRGLQFLLRRQKENGDLYQAQDAVSHNSAWLYSHAIASIALCEALGMTGDQELRGPAQRALEFIESAQDPQYGGWRYQPGEGSDTSVAGWQLMALKSGELAGLTIQPETYEAVRKWLDRARDNGDGSRYLYNPTQPNTQYPADQRRPTMTSVGLLMRLYLGWDRTRPEFKQGAEHILAYPAAYGASSDPKRDTYYWYYATQVMFHMGGEQWEQWRNTLHPLLVNSQIRQGELAGSWHPGGNIPDRWGPHGGRIYVTTMNLLSLEVRYRHLPIYEETAK